ncbi:hypothetical protein CRYUN_Cryun26dG0014100 [Craigia yunnanensis]
MDRPYACLQIMAQRLQRSISQLRVRSRNSVSKSPSSFYKGKCKSGRNCPILTVLKRNLMNWLDPSQHVGIVTYDYLNACPQDGDTEAAAIGKFLPQLEHLEIRFSKLSTKGLGSICEGCLKLEHLDLSGCANLTSRDIVNATSNMKDLKEVKKPNFYIPRSAFHTERYGHWRLYDERFFRI